MDKIANVYIESVKHGVLERHLKQCDPKLVDVNCQEQMELELAYRNGTLVNTVTFFLTI